MTPCYALMLQSAFYGIICGVWLANEVTAISMRTCQSMRGGKSGERRTLSSNDNIVQYQQKGMSCWKAVVCIRI
ncbi:hypothetical protein F4779DRAFT_567745 [Xylariaceae sp. FL0662B]|nr:hypothetical protein F4779DRAFT_567745 [Xylariaceae sp. FL0662B]